MWIVLSGIWMSLPCQDIDVQTVCGTDTIKLCLDNYHFGKVNWQESEDGINWINIKNEHDTVLLYYTPDEKFIRSCITTSDCEQVFSTPALIRQIPDAFAGMDKEVMGSSVTLRGNSIEGATGNWKILSGNFNNSISTDNAIIDFETNDMMSAGESSLHELVWSLENECGSSSDTMLITFISNTYNFNRILVDSTDSIVFELTDTTEGIYCIYFSDTSAFDESTVNDSTILVGYWGNGFLRKIDSFRIILEDTIYQFYTSAATIDDLILDGVLSLGDDLAYLGDTKKSSTDPRVLNHLPTRNELKNDSKYRNGIFVYHYPDEYSFTPIVKSASSDENGFRIPLGGSLEFEDKDKGFTFTVGLNGHIYFDPNFVFSYRFKRFRLRNLKAGMENAILEDSMSLSIGLEWEGGDSLDLNGKKKEVGLNDSKSKELFRKTSRKVIIAGTTPILVTTSLYSDLSIIPHLNAELSGYYSLKRSSSFSAYMVYEKGSGTKAVINKGNSSKSTSYELTLKGSAGIKVVVETGVEMLLYGTIGPYLSLPVSLDPTACYSIRQNQDLDDWQDAWGLNVPLSIDAKIGCRMKMFKKVVFDKSISHNIFKPEFKHPYSLSLISGDNQSPSPVINSLTEPFKLQVKNNLGGKAPGIPVYFSIDPGYGTGTLDNWKVISDWDGYVYNNILLGDPGGYNRIKVEAFNCDFDPLDGAEELFLEVNSGCKNSSLQLSFKFLEDKTVQLSGVMGKKPYNYSLDGQNWDAPQNQSIYDVIDSLIYVKDADNCIASNTISAIDTCLYSELSLGVSLEGTMAFAEGMSGNPPYRYALDPYSQDTTSMYSSQNEFQNLAPGIHKISVIDKSGCISSQDFSIIIEETKDLIAFYPFNGNANEVYRRLPHGVVNGAELVADRFGKEKAAYSFDTADIVTIPYDEDFVCPGDFSIVLWAYTDLVSYDYQDFFSLSIGKEGIDTNGLHFTFKPSDGWMYRKLYTADENSTVSSEVDFDNYEMDWHQYTIVRKMDSISLYIDEQHIGSLFEPGELFRNCDIHIGNSFDKSNPLKGSVDDIRFYKRALFPSEIRGLLHENGWKDGLLTDPYIDPRDGNVYQQVRIGQQVWMTENMKWLPRLSPADSLSPDQALYLVQGYRDTILSEAKGTENYDLYGVLYNYIAAQDVCPSGWHLPTHEDWYELADYISADITMNEDGSFIGNNLGPHLKADWGWESNNGIDDFNFRALPGGYISNMLAGENMIAAFQNVGKDAVWWGKESENIQDKNYTQLHLHVGNNHLDESKLGGSYPQDLSVRCIRDEYIP